MPKEAKEIILYRIAKRYYIDNLSQTEISKIEKISRPQICRFLQEAKDIGIVTIKVSLPNHQNVAVLREKLAEKLPLKELVIMPSKPKDSQQKKLTGLSSVAAEHIAKSIQQSTYVGIGWGEVLYTISKHLSPQGKHQSLTFVPLVGNSGTSNTFLQTNSMVDRFSEKYEANKYYNHSLVLLHEDEISPSEQRRITELEHIWEKLDTAIIGLGGPLSEKKYLQELPEECDKEEMQRHTIGDINANFFKDDGTLYQFPPKYRLLSTSIEKLIHIPNVICVVLGEDRIPAIHYAIEHNIINTLITDSLTASALLDSLD